MKRVTLQILVTLLFRPPLGVWIASLDSAAQTRAATATRQPQETLPDLQLQDKVSHRSLSHLPALCWHLRDCDNSDDMRQLCMSMRIQLWAWMWKSKFKCLHQTEPQANYCFCANRDPGKKRGNRRVAQKTELFSLKIPQVLTKGTDLGVKLTSWTPFNSQQHLHQWFGD